MKRQMLSAICLLVACGFTGVSCAEEMVGAPCVPETDKGTYNTNLKGATTSIETRSVQCETRVCLTRTVLVTAKEQQKFSFCSCRCKDADGHTYQSNPDKYDYLCECPPDTVCQEVLGAIEGAPDKVTGSYCMPNCIASPSLCLAPDVCTPSTDSTQPWKWNCKTP
jgi:hypothetical protein